MYPFGSNRSSTGSAYTGNAAVKTIISKCFEHFARKASTPGL
jgi:hypothetical protein